MTAETVPGTVPAAPLSDDLTPPPPPPPPDTKPKRPTTRAERAAVAAANKAKKATKAEKAPKPSSKPRKASLETRLAGNIATVGTVLAAAGGMASPALSADGVLIVQHSAAIAQALDKVAKDDPRVAAALERMLTVGTWSGLIAALMPVVIGIAANHGAIPTQIAAMLGATPATPPATEPAATGTVPAEGGIL